VSPRGRAHSKGEARAQSEGKEVSLRGESIK
jgi:hypothetical protein